MPRPFDFRQDIADEICHQLIGGDSLRTICDNQAMPSRTRVLQWLAENEAFQGQYARAREAQADAFVDEMIEIADTCEDAAQARLRIDTRKWIASKMRPKKYGEKLDVDVGGTVNLNFSSDDKSVL